MPELRTNKLLFGSRILLLGLVLGALSLRAGVDRGDPRISVLVDQSESVAVEAVGIARQRLQAELEDLSADMTITTDSTRLPALFGQALRKLEPGAQNGILIVSDGHWPDELGDLLEKTANAGVAVFWLPVASAETRPRILGIDAPYRARIGEQLPVTVRTRVPEPETYRAVVFANGEPVGQQTLQGKATATIRFDVLADGALELDAELHDIRTGRLADRLRGGALVNVASTPRLLVLADGDSPAAASLAAGGWSVTQLTPRELQAHRAPISSYSAMILDDIPADSLPEATWARIAETVRRDALGLLVLGGPRSFGLGGYRGSTVEELLPVISEPPPDEPPASVVFLVDVSGSMARQATVANKLLAAQTAVLHAAAALRPQDRVGLIAFDVEAQQLLRTDPREDHAAAIRQVWPAQASGGTSLVPALDLAQAALAGETVEHKLVFLVTDGMLSLEDIANLENRLAADEFELSVMVVLDETVDVPLSRMALGDRGSILIIDDVLRLPLLMRHELEQRRPALEASRSVPSIHSPVPMQDTPMTWPAVDAFLLTTARPGATVMLATDRQDPILAVWTVGTGRVAALTSGLNRWATEWLTWEQWPEFAAGLVNYVAVTNENAVRSGTRDEPRSQQTFLVEHGPREFASEKTGELVLPNGAVASVPLIPRAPGLYRIAAKTEQPGRYTLVWEGHAGLRRHSFVRSAQREPAPVGEAAALRFVEARLLREWPGGWTDGRWSQARMKALLVAIALFALLVAIAAERVPMSQVRRWLSIGRRDVPGDPGLR